jgi:hypothetical protein
MQPPLIYAPYQPRFDWNLWFASLGSWSQYPIVSRTEELLLTNDPDVLQLFASNPFGDKPPKMVRAVIWQYWFSTMREKRTQGIWWQHRLLGTYAPTLAVGPNGTIDIVAEPACLRLGTDFTCNTAALSSRKNENPAIVQIYMPRPLNDRHTRNVQHKKACVIGAGPNGLAAAIVLAQTGLEVEVFEAESLPGGAARTMELTLPGFLHDFASAVHPMTVGSPFFSTLPLHDCGLEWIHSPALLAHPMDDGTAVLLERNFDDAQSALGGDGAAWRDLMEPLVERRAELARDIMRPPLSWPRHPFLLARFAIHAIRSAGFVARHRFRTERVRALFAGLSAHSFLSLDQALSASFGIVMGASAHAVGWPIPRGGAQSITNALSGYLEALGGRIRTSTCIDNFQQLSRCDLTLCDVTPHQLLRISGKKFSPSAIEID